MSLSTVLKNIFSFTEILSQASTNVVSKWDEKSLKNAFNWAAYCEEVYENVKDQSLRDTIERQAQEMTSLLVLPSCVTMNFDSLGRATQILEEKLLLNCHLKTETLEKLIDPENQPTERFSGLISLVNQVKLSSSLIQQMEKLDLISTTSEIPVQSRLLFEHFIHQHQVIRKHERFCFYVNSVLTRISSLEDGMRLIICLVAVYQEDYSRNEDQAGQKINQLIFTWLDALINSQPQKLVLVNKKVLCEVSACNTDFFDLYSQCLVGWAQHMTPDYHKDHFPRLYMWRPSKECYNGSYEELLEHFKVLITSQPYFHHMVIDGLQTLRQDQNTLFSIWSDIVKDLKCFIKR